MVAFSKMSKRRKFPTFFFAIILVHIDPASLNETQDAFQHWTGRWLPERPNDPTPPPKVLPNLSKLENASGAFNNWVGRWFPERPNDPTPPPKVLPNFLDHANGTKSGQNYPVMMGSSDDCDSGGDNLTVDWDESPINYTCFGKKIIPEKETVPVQTCVPISKAYIAQHHCMYESIEYSEDIPVYGPHRPAWPVYGKYKFVPRQRWLHSLEHGAVVMLYHPCANSLEVNLLEKLVTGCLRRHIISPYNLLDKKRPLALLTWGCRLEMAYVKPAVVKNFIKTKARKGAETRFDDGDFRFGLIQPARIVSDEADSHLCPQFHA